MVNESLRKRFYTQIMVFTFYTFPFFSIFSIPVQLLILLSKAVVKLSITAAFTF